MKLEFKKSFLSFFVSMHTQYNIICRMALNYLLYALWNFHNPMQFTTTRTEAVNKSLILISLFLYGCHWWIFVCLIFHPKNLRQCGQFISLWGFWKHGMEIRIITFLALRLTQSRHPLIIQSLTQNIFLMHLFW
jgi:hypothetical protein